MIVNNVIPSYMEKSELVTLIVTLVVSVIGGIVIFLYSRRPARVNVIELAGQHARGDPVLHALFLNTTNDRPSGLNPTEENALVDEIIGQFANGNIVTFNENNNECNGDLSRGLEGHRRKQRRRRSRKSKRV